MARGRPDLDPPEGDTGRTELFVSAPPANPKIYHITPVSNIPQIINDGELRSDALMAAIGGPPVAIGMSSIKARRMRLPVKCRPGTVVGEYVPFYFCPRSVMLYLIYRGNHRDLAYRGGQDPIVHLEADLGASIAWANASGRDWSYSTSNAGSFYAQFGCDSAGLHRIDWASVANTDNRNVDVKEGKQAEFLVKSSFPWVLIDRIGVRTQATSVAVRAALRNAAHQPRLQIMPGWYF